MLPKQQQQIRHLKYIGKVKLNTMLAFQSVLFATSELTCAANEVQRSKPCEHSISSSISIIRHVAGLIAGLGSMQSIPIPRHTLT
jgi:hypothetical protein